jgi:hypothetical protein
VNAARRAELAQLREQYHDAVDRVVALMSVLADTANGERRQGLLDEAERWRSEAAALEVAYQRLALPPSAAERGDGQVEEG